MAGTVGLTNIEQHLQFGHVTTIAVPCVQIVRQVKDWLRPIVDLPQATVEGLRAVQILACKTQLLKSGKLSDVPKHETRREWKTRNQFHNFSKVNVSNSRWVDLRL
jgi:hypothetical protein